MVPASASHTVSRRICRALCRICRALCTRYWAHDIFYTKRHFEHTIFFIQNAILFRDKYIHNILIRVTNENIVYVFAHDMFYTKLLGCFIQNRLLLIYWVSLATQESASVSHTVSRRTHRVLLTQSRPFWTQCNALLRRRNLLRHLAR